MDADRAFGFAAAAEQIAEREMHVGSFRVELDDFDEGVDRLVRLLVEQEIQALEIAARQAARLRYQLPDVDPRGDPAEAEKNRDAEQPPGFKFHAARRREFIPTQSYQMPDGLTARLSGCWRLRPRRMLFLRLLLLALSLAFPGA